MYFTQEDYLKIQQWLQRNSVKDTEFQEAADLIGNEVVTLVQNGSNKKVYLKDLVNQIFSIGVADFVNISTLCNEYNITLSYAIKLVPYKSRKRGQVITFLNIEGNWEIYQFTGVKTQWNNIELWKDLFDWQAILNLEIGADEEDITSNISNEEEKIKLAFKNREYDPLTHSGLGYKILRKNIVQYTDPTHGELTKNILYQDMVSNTYTIYEIRYDFDLNGQTINIPEGCVLQYRGGSLSNGTLIYEDTIIEGVERLSNVNIEGNYKYPYTGDETSPDEQLAPTLRQVRKLSTEVNNIADDEDLTKIYDEEKGQEVLQLKDRQYVQGSNNGMGYVILRQNKPFKEQLTQSNTIYEIRYDFDLDGEKVEIPENCVLKFGGGSLGNGSIIGNNTSISPQLTKIFDLNVEFGGNWCINEWYPEWFGAIPYAKPTETDPYIYITDSAYASSVPAFRAINRCMNDTNIKTIKLNAVYYVDDEITLVNTSGLTAVNIISDNPNNGFIFHIQDEDKCCLRVAQGDTYGVFGSLYENFRFYPAIKEGEGSKVKAIFLCENHIGSTHRRIRVTSTCKVSEGVFTMHILSGNIFNNKYEDLEAAYQTGHGLKYKVEDGAYHAILQNIHNCRFHGLAGCGIVTDIRPIASAAFNGEIINCELEGNTKGSLFIGKTDNLYLSNVYFEGKMQEAVDNTLPCSPFILGFYKDNSKIHYSNTGLTINRLNCGDVGSNVKFAIYLGQGTEEERAQLSSVTRVLKNVDIRGINKTNNVPYYTSLSWATNTFIQYPTSGFDDVLIFPQYCLNVTLQAYDGQRKVSEVEQDITQPDPSFEILNFDKFFKITNNILSYERDTSNYIDLKENQRIRLEGKVFVAPYGGRLYYNAKGNYTQGSYDIANVNATWILDSEGDVGAVLTGPYWNGGKAVVTAIDGTTISVDKPSLITKQSGLVSLGFMIDERFWNATTGKTDGDYVSIGTMSFYNGKPIWWNGTTWVDATGVEV